MEKQVVKKHTDADVIEASAKVGGKQNLRVVTIATEDGIDYEYLVKKPSRSVMSAIAKYEEKKDTNAIEKMMLGCVLFGDADAYEHDGAVYNQLMTEIGKLVQTAKGSTKKL